MFLIPSRYALLLSRSTNYNLYRYYKTTKTTSSQVPSFGEIYQQRHNAAVHSSSSSHQRSAAMHQQSYRPIVEMPATPDSTLHFINRSGSLAAESQGGSNYCGTSGYSSFNHRTMSNSETHLPNENNYKRVSNASESLNRGRIKNI